MAQGYRDWLTAGDFQCLQRPSKLLLGSGRPVAEAQEGGGAPGNQQQQDPRASSSSSSAAGAPWSGGGAAGRPWPGPAPQPAASSSSSPGPAPLPLSSCLAVDPSALDGLIPALWVPDEDDAGGAQRGQPSGAGPSSLGPPWPLTSADGSASSGPLCRPSEGGELAPLVQSDSIISQMAVVKRQAAAAGCG
jgi:hypothetical protein